MKEKHKKKLLDRKAVLKKNMKEYEKNCETMNGNQYFSGTVIITFEAA